MRARGLAVAFVCAVALGGVACSNSSSSDGSCTSFTTTTSVEVKDYAYVPNCISVAPEAELSLTNSGAVPHTFTVKDADPNGDVKAGSSGTLSLAGLAAGTYDVVCTYHPGQMSATLKVG
jgi:plastocyanin